MERSDKLSNFRKSRRAKKYFSPSTERKTDAKLNLNKASSSSMKNDLGEAKSDEGSDSSFHRLQNILRSAGGEPTMSDVAVGGARFTELRDAAALLDRQQAESASLAGAKAAEKSNLSLGEQAGLANGQLPTSLGSYPYGGAGYHYVPSQYKHPPPPPLAPPPPPPAPLFGEQGYMGARFPYQQRSPPSTIASPSPLFAGSMRFRENLGNASAFTSVKGNGVPSASTSVKGNEEMKQNTADYAMPQFPVIDAAFSVPGLNNPSNEMKNSMYQNFGVRPMPGMPQTLGENKSSALHEIPFPPPPPGIKFDKLLKSSATFAPPSPTGIVPSEKEASMEGPARMRENRSKAKVAADRVTGGDGLSEEQKEKKVGATQKSSSSVSLSQTAAKNNTSQKLEKKETPSRTTAVTDHTAVVNGEGGEKKTVKTVSEHQKQVREQAQRQAETLSEHQKQVRAQAQRQAETLSEHQKQVREQAQRQAETLSEHQKQVRAQAQSQALFSASQNNPRQMYPQSQLDLFAPFGPVMKSNRPQPSSVFRGSNIVGQRHFLDTD
eukprot:g276.t1